MASRAVRGLKLTTRSGQNLPSETRSFDDRFDAVGAPGQFDRFPEIAHQIVVTRPDVIYGLSNILIRALLSETRTIPIVAWSGDPIAAGFVSSLARPGGNVTGVSADTGAEMNGKRVALLAEAVGKLDALTTPAIWQTASYDPVSSS